MTNDEEILFVGIKDPSEVRKAILESSRGIIVSLERYEKFKSTRTKRIAEITRLKGTLKEINKLILRLKSELPKIKLPEPKKKVKLVKKPKAEPRLAPKKEFTELEKLESELDEINKKLTGIY